MYTYLQNTPSRAIHLFFLLNQSSRIPGPKGYKTFSCSTQMSMKFQLLMKKTKMSKQRLFMLSNAQVVFIMLV